MRIHERLRWLMACLMVVAGDAGAYQVTAWAATDPAPFPDPLTETNGRTRLVQEDTFPGQYAYAEADLSTGSLRVIAQSPIQRAAAIASWNDTLFFDLTALSSSTSVDIAFRATVDGTYEAGSQPTFDFYAFTNSIPGISPGDSLRAGVGYRASTAGTVFSTAAPEIFRVFSQEGDFTTFGPAAFFGLLTLHGGGVRSVGIGMALSGDTSVNFGNTAYFSVLTDLPFTSESGVFPASPVPIPAAGWLLLSGLGGLAALRRRNRAA